jgi:hypothetical protein
LVINECICDIQSRINKLVQKKIKPLEVSIEGIEVNKNGQVEVVINLMNLMGEGGEEREGSRGKFK